MKIKMNDQAHITTFGAIDTGEIFVWDDDAYIKTEQSGPFETIANAVELRTGCFYRFKGSEEVTRPTSYEFSVDY